ncbi:signal peptidase I [Ornithinibacillus bavariensis]|uniref:Signal peptidase I n=1 Tax=Ornithinibacillus bavariensis TaxID=545502 RepID=A0A919X589_9BACI|nr:signal peptidase I [Ornithinibacillus bavariensis]GIO26132.1 signal peptidase I [Ornithinibacillus bavariensis]HAM79372.1 signal peptidase I [Ornithinibacillus sp.]
MAKTKEKSDWFDWVKALLIAFVLAFLVRTFLFTPIVVDGPSMQPTLHNRDQMIVNKFIYRIDEPERFDIVVFHANDQKDFIKRVIGLPGDHVAYKDNVLYINGQPIKEKFFQDDNIVMTYDFTLEEVTGNYSTVPEGHVFVLGDNRTNSTDSRILGPIPIDQIVGKASVIYWPFDRMQLLGE